MVYILYLNFELLETVLENKCLRFVLYHWINEFNFPQQCKKLYKNEIGLIREGYENKEFLLTSFLKIEKETFQTFEESYLENSIIVVNYLHELKTVQQICGVDCVVGTLYVNDSDKQTHKSYTDVL